MNRPRGLPSLRRASLRLVLPFVVAGLVGVFLSVASHELGWSSTTTQVVGLALVTVIVLFGAPLAFLPVDRGARPAMGPRQTATPAQEDDPPATTGEMRTWRNLRLALGNASRGYTAAAARNAATRELLERDLAARSVRAMLAAASHQLENEEVIRASRGVPKLGWYESEGLRDMLRVLPPSVRVLVLPLRSRESEWTTAENTVSLPGDRERVAAHLSGRRANPRRQEIVGVISHNRD